MYVLGIPFALLDLLFAFLCYALYPREPTCAEHTKVSLAPWLLTGENSLSGVHRQELRIRWGIVAFIPLLPPFGSLKTSCSLNQVLTKLLSSRSFCQLSWFPGSHNCPSFHLSPLQAQRYHQQCGHILHYYFWLL